MVVGGCLNTRRTHVGNAGIAGLKDQHRAGVGVDGVLGVALKPGVANLQAGTVGEGLGHAQAIAQGGVEADAARGAGGRISRERARLLHRVDVIDVAGAKIQEIRKHATTMAPQRIKAAVAVVVVHVLARARFGNRRRWCGAEVIVETGFKSVAVVPAGWLEKAGLLQRGLIGCRGKSRQGRLSLGRRQ